MNSDETNRIINVDNIHQGLMSSSTLSSISSSSTLASNVEQKQQQPLLLEPVQSQVTDDKNKPSSGQTIKLSLPSVEAEETVTVVRMRNRPLSKIQQQVTTNGTVPERNENNKNSSLAVLQHGLEVLNEITPEDDGNEEIRRLDSQLDHLNHYMDKVEERIKAHNEKLMDTLKHQREEREKRRRSFHERIALNQQEDDDFQRQISTLLSRVDISKNRASMYDIISQMEIPKPNGH
ncbi:Uncharacterized protein BM_BM2216 [Brugia malayi]|uniref:Bm2216 n=3 Tax=Brugia malayi TaxID=6279 RepID=A0A0K0J4Z3_BRUMA|nr:Uncharacterized protein BM_BM2216 [Brugia malayi]CTP81041.1 Bm2216 [Brugia malayi]VIO88704.1 Uncharacterized protein BM_BM2216 [Brugia malayi]